MFAALCAGIVGTTYGLLRAKSESERARESESIAIAQADIAEKAAAAEQQQRKRADSESAASQAVRDFLQEDLLRGSSVIHQAESISPLESGKPFLINPTIKQLGRDHVHTVKARYHLAIAFQSVGDLDQGLEIMQQLDVGWSRPIRTDHPYFLTGILSLVQMYQQSNQIERAITTSIKADFNFIVPCRSPHLRTHSRRRI